MGLSISNEHKPTSDGRIGLGDCETASSDETSVQEGDREEEVCEGAEDEEAPLVCSCDECAGKIADDST